MNAHFQEILNSTMKINLQELQQLDNDPKITELNVPATIKNSHLLRVSFGIRQVGDIEELRVCMVCDKKMGTERLFYEQKICSSCRAFFKRALVKNNYKSFNCCKSSLCFIDSKSWKSCRFCRFCRCLRVGLGNRISEKMLTDIKFHISNVNKVTGKNFMKELRLADDSLEVPFHKEEKNLFLHLCQQINDFINLVTLKIYSTNIECFALIALAGKTHKIPFSVIRLVKEMWESPTISHFWKYCELEDFMSLPTSDKLKLMANNMAKSVRLYFIIMWSNESLITEEGLTIKHPLKYLKDLNESDVERFNFTELVNWVKENGLYNSKRSQVVTYQEIFSSPWASAKEIEEEHKKIFVEIQALAQNDPIKGNLIWMIYFFSLNDEETYFCIDKIQSLKQKYTLILNRYMKWKYGVNHFWDGKYMKHLIDQSRAMSHNRLPV